MTVEELKQTLLGREYPESILIADHILVTDIPTFLKTQFYECDNWKKDIKKCSSYQRLMIFHNNINTIETK